MDDKFLNWIYETHFSKTGNSFDQFKNDMSDLGFRKWVHGKYFSDKSSLDQFESDLGINSTQPQAQINQPEDEDTDFEKAARKIPLVGDILARGSKLVRSGVQSGSQVNEGINIIAKNGELSDEELQETATILQKNRKQILDENSYSSRHSRGELKGWKDYLGLASETIVQSAALMGRAALDAFTDSKTAGIAGTSAGVGAAVGSQIPVVGTVVGGLAALAGGVSGLSETSSIVFEELTNELNKRGLEPNSYNIKSVLSDQDWMDSMTTRAISKGAVVGGVDMLTGFLSAGSAGRAGRKLAEAGLKPTAKSIAKTAIKTTGIEAAGGSIGEAASQIAVEGKIYDPVGVALEGVSEILTSAPTTAISYTRGVRKEAKVNRTLADATGSSITKEEKEESEKPLSVPDGLDAIEAGDKVTANQAAADVVLRHTPEELIEMTDAFSKTEGTSKEVIDQWHSKLEEALKVSQSFNTPEIEANPEAKSRAVAVRMNTNEIKAQRDALEEKMNLADETLRPQYEEQLKELDTLIEDNNQTISSIITRKETEISDDPIYYGNKALELETNLANDKKQLSEKERALFDIGKKMEKTLLDASRDDEFFQNSKNSLITHFDENPLSEGSNNVSLKKEVKHIGDFFSKKPPKRFLERLGGGDIILGETLFGQGKALYDEIKTIQSKLNPNFLRTSKLAVEENRRRQKSILDKQRDQLFEDQKIDEVTDVSGSALKDVEAKKADIERKIQEVEDFVNQDFFANSELLSKHWKTKKDLFENKVKQLRELLQKGIKTGKDLRTLTNLLNDIRGVLNEGLNINNKDNVEINEKNIQKLANSLFSMISDDVIKDYINEMNSVMETRFGKDAVSKQLIQYTTGEWTLDGKNVEYFLSKESLENAKNNKQINAKYDAELATLEETSGVSGSALKDVERISNKEIKTNEGEINTGVLEEAKDIPNVNKVIAKDKNGNDIKVVINGDKLKGTILSRNGTYLFKAMQGRVFTLAKVGNFYLPFYISSAGTSGKIQGQWYPFFGYNNWLVKGHVGKSGEMEYSKNITEVQNLLNENFIIPAQYLQADNVVAVGEQFVPERDANGKIIREGKYNFEKMIPNKDRKVLYDLTKDIDIITHHHQEQKGETKLNEHDWVAEKTGLNPKKVINDGKGSADNWIKKLVELTETKSKAPTQYTEAAGGSALKDVEGKKADIERRRQEELNQQTDAGYSTIALDYLFTGGRDVMLSTDYLLQALVGGFTSAAKEINDIRNKYANKLGNIRDDINSDVYNQMMGEIRNVISKTYNDSKANEIFDKILKNATGFTNREGNQISIELDKLNEQNESKINAKYDAELAELEESKTLEQQVSDFGTQADDVKPVASVIEKVFNWTKQAGLTAAKTVGDWVGIGKGSEKPYSLKINGKEVQVKNVQPEVVNGFYSPLEKVITESKFDKLPAKQWAEKYANSEEAKWTGLKDWLANQQGSLSKSDIQQYLKDNRIQVVEVVKTQKDYRDDWDKENDNPKDLTKFSQYQLEGEKENYKEVLVTMPNRELSKAPNWNEKQVSLNLSSRGDYSESQKRWTSTIDGDEATITELPEKGKYVLDYRGIVNAQFDTFKEAEKYITAKESQNRVKGKSDFKSTHFDEPNILVHLRMNTRVDAEGKKVLFLEEVQSDWGQKGKKEGFEIKEEDRWNFEPIKRNGETVAWKIELKSDKNIGGIGNTKEDAIKDANKRYGTEINTLEKQQKGTPSAPFVTDTNAWTKLGLKVAIKEAVKQGADKIAWSTGTQQFDRWGSERIDWRKDEDDSGNPMWNITVNEQQGGNVFTGTDLESRSLKEKGININSKESLREILKRNLSRERNDTEIDKLTDRIWNRMQTEDSGTSLPRKEGMEEFYGNPKDMERAKDFTVKKEGDVFAVKDEKGKTIRTFKQENEANKFKENYGLGIVGNVAKSLFKQEPKSVVISKGYVEKNIETKTLDELNNANKSNKELWIENKDNGNIFSASYTEAKDALSKGYKVGYWDKGKDNSTQHSIDITPELKAEAEGGLPLFKGVGDYVETSGYRKQMTEDDKGNYLFFHYSNKKFNQLNPGTVGTHLATSREEKTKIGVSSLYTRPDVLEPSVPSDYGYIIRVPKKNVYTFNTDPLNLLEKAKERFEKGRNGAAFDRNNQLAYVAKLAAEKGFPVTIAEWNIKGTKSLIAKTTENLGVEKYTNIKPGTLNQTEYAKGTENIKPNAKRRDIPSLFKDNVAQYRIESGENIVEAIKEFNGSPEATVALTHEIMHPTVVAIIDGAKEGNKVGTRHTQTIVDEFNKANPNRKVTVEDLIKGNDEFKNGDTSKQYRAVQEFIANSWEKYHTEGGKGFSDAFQKVLDQITKAFQSVYKSITGKQLTPELKQMFDEILGKEAVEQPIKGEQLLPEIQELETKKEIEITQALKPNFGKKDEIPSVLTNKEIEKVVKSDSVSPSEVKSVGEALESKREELTKQLQELKSLRDCIWG